MRLFRENFQVFITDVDPSSDDIIFSTTAADDATRINWKWPDSPTLHAYVFKSRVPVGERLEEADSWMEERRAKIIQTLE